MHRKHGKKPKRKFYARLRIDVKHYPTTVYEILEALFPNHREYVDFAYFLVKKARDGGWDKGEWIKVILEFIHEYSKVYNLGVTPQAVKELLEVYEGYDTRYSATTRNRKIKALAKEKGIDLDVWYYKYRSILKRLRRLGMIYEKNGHYSQSKEFLKILQKMTEAMIDFYSGKDEEW